MDGPILVVDDERDIRETLQEVLELEGHHVQTAANGLEALKRMRAERPSLVLLDLMMPVMNGFELLERLQKERGLEEVPIVVVSAFTRLARELEERGFDVVTFLPKPVEFDELVSIASRYDSKGPMT